MSIFAGVPAAMPQAFIVSRFQGNRVNAIPRIFPGFDSVFMHGGYNGSMYFDVMAGIFGFSRYSGYSEYPEKATDDDGHWGIFDGPYFQHAVREIDLLRPPFAAAIVSLTSHQPYRIPEKLEADFPSGTLPIHRTIRYADAALRDFFIEARKRDWYKNTLFVVTADHSGDNELPMFNTAVGKMRIPIIFFWPGGTLPLNDKDIAQHADIAPTVADLLLGVDRKLALPRFGQSLACQSELRQAFFYDGGVYWGVSEGRALRSPDGIEMQQFDWLFDKDLSRGKQLTESEPLTELLRAKIQYFNNAMNDDRLHLQ
jgi:phosphoglycerol transferase MdoB-like AlkP superfamily enzyme